MDLGDGNGPQQLNGLTFLLQLLSRSFAPLVEETNLRAISDLYSFTKQPGERTDAIMARFENTRLRARTQGGIALGPIQAAWMLLLALKISPRFWVQVLQPFGGQLPQNEQQGEGVGFKQIRHEK